MKCLLKMLVIVGLMTVGLYAQTTPTVTIPQFSISATAMPFSGNDETAPATDVGGLLQVTTNAFFRSDNILIPAFSSTTNLGGIDYMLPSKWIARTKLPSQNLFPYLSGSMGISRSGTSQTNHFAMLAGGGLKYCTGMLCVSMVEVRYAKINGLNNNTVIVSSGLQLGWHW